MKKIQFQPKYIQVKEAILEKIRKKIFPDNSFLPPEAELESIFKASRNTIRSAMKSLREDGIVTSSQGRQSRIDAGKILPGKTLGKVAWLDTEYIGNEGVYFEIFKYMTYCAKNNDLSLDYINIAFDPDSGNIIKNLPSYAGIVITGRVIKGKISDELFRVLSEAPNVIAIDNVEGLPSKFIIGTDNRKGAEMAVKHLSEEGRKKIAFLGISPSFYRYMPFAERLRGYQDAVKKLSLKSDPALTIISDEIKDCYDLRPVLEKALKKNPGIDAFFALTDFIAIQAIYTLKNMDIKVPFDISVTGFDGLPAGEYVSPRLTTVAQPFEAIAETVIDNILKGSSSSKNRFIPIKPSLIARES